MATAKAFLSILDMAAQKFNCSTPNETMGQNIKTRYNLSQTSKYFGNKYHELKAKDPDQIVSAQEAPFNALAHVTGYKNFKNYLIQKGYPLPPKNTAAATATKQTDKNNQPDKNKLQALQQYNTVNPAQSGKKYYWQTQVIPALVAFAPLFISIGILYQTSSKILAFLTLGWAATGLLMAKVIAGMGKSIEKKMLEKNGIMQYPTITKMIYTAKGTFRDDQKEEYRKKINALFHIQFPNKHEEAENPAQATICLNSAISKLKEYVKTNKIEAAHLRYMQYRNLLPALCMAFIFSLLGSLPHLLGGQSEALYLQLGLLAGTIILFFITTKNITTASEAFAQYLIEEFLRREV